MRKASYTSFKGFKAYARAIVPLMDHKARNLLFDVLTSHRATIATQWGREIARMVSRLAYAHAEPSVTSFPSYSKVQGLWVAPPEEAAPLRTKMAHAFVIPVEGASTFAVRDIFFPLGRLHCGKTEIVSREVHDRWEVAATIDYDLDIDLSRVEPERFTDLPSVEHRAEVV